MKKHYRQFLLTALLFCVIFFPHSNALSQGHSQKNLCPCKAEVKILIAANDDSQIDSADLYDEARNLYAENRYDEVIRLLSGPCYRNSTNIELNILLAKAQTEKCARLKEQGDKSYKKLIRQPYVTAVRLHKMTGMNPELYYISARCLFINNRPSRAKRSIRKALYFKPGNPEYLVTLGDINISLANRAKRDGEDPVMYEDLYSNAKDAYQQALAAKRDDDAFVKRIEEKLKNLPK